MGGVNITSVDQRRHGSVTERLSARLDEIDPVIGRMLKNEAKLIADSLTVARLLQAQEDALRQQITVLMEHEQRHDRTSVFIGASFWERLRWLFRGV